MIITLHYGVVYGRQHKLLHQLDAYNPSNPIKNKNIIDIYLVIFQMQDMSKLIQMYYSLFSANKIDNYIFFFASLAVHYKHGKPVA